MKALFIAMMSCVVVYAQLLQAAEVYGQPDVPLAAEVLDTQVRTADAEEMKYAILSRLLDRYAADNRIEVAPEEIDAYVKAVDRAMADDRTKREARRDDIARQLDGSTLTETEREALSSELAMLNGLLDGAGTQDTGEDSAARQQVAAAFIRQWKINGQLYRQYSGRIIFQQGGPEPLDAYRQYLEEQARKGAFRILDEALEAEFWRYYRTDSIHSFYEPGSKEEAQVFETPPWLPAEPGDAR